MADGRIDRERRCSLWTVCIFIITCPDELTQTLNIISSCIDVRLGAQVYFTTHQRVVLIVRMVFRQESRISHSLFYASILLAEL